MTSDKRTELAYRIREIRLDSYGECGLPAFAEPLNLPSRTWVNYEQGVTLPADVLLRFLEVTGTNPHWLQTGKGENAIMRVGNTN